MMRILSKTSLCSSLAIATALVVGARPAAAQVVGNLNNAGGATIAPDGSSVILNAPQTTIDWTATGTPSGGVRDFLPSGNVMAFSGSSDFAVLNRVSSGADMIGLNGSITATVGAAKGGTVFFYNPNGIVVGGSAIIDVGSLGLTTAPVNGADTANWFPGFNAASPHLTFNPAAGGSEIRIESGAGAIMSNGTNSFIAVVAPKISSSGTIKTDGDVALVAAEAATLQFSPQYDLYSIQVDIGTGVSDSLTVNGGSIGRNSAVETADVARRAYLVTVPKNDATTLLITGGANIGFDVANSAVVEGNSIILSAGRDTAFVGDEVDGGKVTIEQSTVSSYVDAYATDQISIGSDSGNIHFLTDAEFRASIGIDIAARGGDVTFDGDMLADTSEFSSPGESATGGLVSLGASGGHTLTVIGDTRLEADGEGGYQFESGLDGGNGTGGVIDVIASGGTISLASLHISAEGQGGAPSDLATGGMGTGGTVTIDAGNGGSIGASAIVVRATGYGGSNGECSLCGIAGGDGHGGTVTITAAGTGSAITAGSTDVLANGEGGAGDLGGGTGFGGTLNVTLTGLVDVDLGGFDELYADGIGGYGTEDGSGGIGIGGTTTLTMTEADGDRPTLVAGDLYMSADGLGGYSGNGQDGGQGAGGTMTATISGGDVDAGSLLLSAIGRGGSSYDATAGNSSGGEASLTMSDGRMTLDGTLTINASALRPNSEGAGGAGNIAIGGTATLDLTNSSLTTNASGDFAANSLWVGANAIGENAFADGGSAHGGTVDVTLSGSTVSAGDIILDSHAVGGAGYDLNGGFGEGGDQQLNVTGSTITARKFSLLIDGNGGNSNALAGGAMGGSATASLSGSTISLTSLFEVAANGLGGAGLDYGADGGSATGGGFDLTLENSTLTSTDLQLQAEGHGGNVYGDASGGDGTGGHITFQLDGGDTVTTGAFEMFATGYGGENGHECNDCGTSGGNGQGGVVHFFAAGGANAVTATDYFYFMGSGIGGAGDVRGGDGFGNEAWEQLSAGTSLTMVNHWLFADGAGGQGYGDADGGAAHGGSARVLFSDGGGGSITYNGTDLFHVTAEAFGGAAENGAGGQATGGTAEFFGNGLTLNAANGGAWISAYALGGNSIDGAGGSATGGSSQVSLSNGASMTLARYIGLNSYAKGGNGQIGGNASAGAAQLSVDNSTLASGTGQTAAQFGVQLYAYATGGDGAFGDGGDAVANLASLRAVNGGTINSTSAQIDSVAQGGDSVGGTRAGDADGGVSEIVAQGGASVHLTGAAKVMAAATGGTGSDGADGGDAAADSFALVNALGGGSVHVDGDLTMSVDRTGGDGQNGGAAFAIIDYQTPTVGETYPVAEILAQGGSVTVGGLTAMTADSIGGDGSLGGNGGGAFGGTVSLRAPNSAVAPSVITLGNTTLSATATAGAGGQGLTSEVGDGGNGGNGGDALGGMIFIQAMSLDGQITTGDLILATTATAGSGGDGGSGINGGNGGQGGMVATNWSAGAIFFSIPSGGNPTGLPLVTNGFVHLGDVTADTSALGGDGGWGGFAYDGTNGSAGNGGYAQSGDFYILVRGGDMAGGNLDWSFDANGGAAGANPDESPAGTGGSASTGELLLSNTNRAGQIDQRGTMTFGNLTGVGQATGGYGLTTGASLYTSSLDFETTNSDTHLASLTYQAFASDGPAIAGYDLTSLIAVQNGTVLIDGAMTVAVPDAMAVWLDNGTLTAGSVDLSASNFVPSANPAPPAPGTIRAGSLSVASNQDIILQANLDIGGGIGLDAPGTVSIESATSHDGGINLTSEGGLVFAKDLSAVGDVNLTASGDITTSGIESGGSILADGAKVTVGEVAANGDLSLYATGLLTATGGLTAGGNLDIAGNGVVISGASGAGGTLSMTSYLQLSAGDISAYGDVSLMAATTLAALDVYSETGDIDGFAGQSLSLTSADAGGDLSLEAGGGGILLAAASQAGGAIDFGSSGLIETAALSAQGTVTVIGGAIDVGNVDSGVDIGLWSGGTIAAGNLVAAERIGLAAPGSISAGSIDAGDLAMLLGGAGVSTGAITAGGELYIGNYAMFALGYDALNEDFDPTPVLAQAPQATGGSVAIGGAIQATQVRAAVGGNWTSGGIGAASGPVSIDASGGIVAGNVSATGNVALDANGGPITTGSINGANVAIASGGAMSANGAVTSANTIQIVAAGNVTLQSASAANYADITGANVQIGAFSTPISNIAAAGTLSVNGAWTVNSLFAESRDIAIAPAGSINGNYAQLVSTNTTGAGIGNNSGAANGSFVLDNGELSRIGSSTLQVFAIENAAPIDLLIGTTTLAGGGRYYDFGVVDTNESYAGRLRVTGKITGQNFTDEDELDLDARLMEVDAVNGGIDFSPNSDATVGILGFYGERVHVAEAAVLDQLAVDTQYADRDLDLATAPTAAHAETTINVGTVNVELFQTGQVGQAVGQAASPYSIYVQNMGSNGTRSGLLISDANLYGEIGPGSVEMILNGKLVDPETGAQLSGAAARDAFIGDPENDLTYYTASSSINGCGLDGSSCFTPLPPPPPPNPQVEDLANQFVFLDTSVGDQLGFGDDADSASDNADDDDDASKTEERTAIDPPPAVINGKPLDPQTPTDEPVSGSGNPALIGAGTNQQEQQ